MIIQLLYRTTTICVGLPLRCITHAVNRAIKYEHQIRLCVARIITTKCFISIRLNDTPASRRPSTYSLVIMTTSPTVCPSPALPYRIRDPHSGPGPRFLSRLGRRDARAARTGAEMFSSSWLSQPVPVADRVFQDGVDLMNPRTHVTIGKWTATRDSDTLVRQPQPHTAPPQPSARASTAIARTPPAPRAPRREARARRGEGGRGRRGLLKKSGPTFPPAGARGMLSNLRARS